MLLKRVKNNRAENPELVSMPSIAPKNIVPEISELPDRKWSEEEENIFELF